MGKLPERQKLATAIAKAPGGGRILAKNHTFPPLAPRTAPQPPRDYGTWMEVQDTVMAGDTYGLEFPYSATMLADERKWGSKWLTLALRKAGAIEPTNAVTIVGVQEFVGGGAASKALLTVRYDDPESARRDGALQAELFVKMPHLVPQVPTQRPRKKTLGTSRASFASVLLSLCVCVCVE